MGSIEEERRRVEAQRETARRAQVLRIQEEASQRQIKTVQEQAKREQEKHQEGLRIKAWTQFDSSALPELIRKLSQIRYLKIHEETPSSGKFEARGSLKNRRTINAINEFSVGKVLMWDDDNVVVIETDSEGLMTFHGKKSRSVKASEWRKDPSKLEEELGIAYRDPIKLLIDNRSEWERFKDSGEAPGPGSL